MVKLGQVMFDDEKKAINLELSAMVEDSLTKQENRRIVVLWGELASLIENSLRRAK